MFICSECKKQLTECRCDQPEPSWIMVVIFAAAFIGFIYAIEAFFGLAAP